MLNQKIKYQLLFSYFIILCFFLCYEFSQLNIKSWDEAVYANNAIEMNKNGDWWVMYNNSQPDFYNTKPPFVIWLQSISISIFGVSEFAIRLPSFISLFFITIILFHFLQKKFENSFLPFFPLSILLSSAGLLGFHGFATGDLDATLCLWITAYSVIILDKIILSDKKLNAKWIYFAGLFILLAFLTKSTAAFLPIPGLLISIFIFNKQKKLFWNKHFYIVCFLIIFLIVGYYYMMEMNRPGYFNHVWNSEYKRIYSNIMPWHTQSFGYYFKNLSIRFFPWFWILIPSIILGLRSKRNIVKKLTIFSFVFCTSYLLIISIPEVKLEWYDLPAYPFLAILTSVVFFEVISWLKSFFSTRAIIFVPVFSLLFIVAAVVSMIYSIQRIKHPSFNEPLEREGIALRQLIKEPLISNLKILMQANHQEHFNQINFYRERYYTKKKKLPKLIPIVNEIVPDDTILVCQQVKIDSLARFRIDTIRKINNCFLIHIISDSTFIKNHHK
jgi:4-amino-4-deoxy-L-arabinose transferase-like glycosyltransferase